MKVQSLSTTGSLTTTTLKTELFSGEANSVLMAQAVRVYRAAARQGTAKTKTRGEISRTKKKWFKQKHTGNARHGARTPNIFVGGGVSHGPTGTQNWLLSMPQKMRRQALRSALISQAAQVVVVEAFQGSTKDMRGMLKEVVSEKSLTLVILPTAEVSVIKALRNMPTVKIVTADRVSIMDVAVADYVLVTAEAITSLEDRLLNGKVKAVKPAKVAEPVKAETKAVKAAAKKPAVAKKPATKKPAAKKVTKKAEK